MNKQSLEMNDDDTIGSMSESSSDYGSNPDYVGVESTFNLLAVLKEEQDSISKTSTNSQLSPTTSLTKVSSRKSSTTSISSTGSKKNGSENDANRYV